MMAIEVVKRGFPDGEPWAGRLLGRRGCGRVV
jgi:hypothetical protein